MTAKVERISNHNYYRVFVTSKSGVIFSATMQGYSEPPPEDFIIQLFNNSNIKEWFIEVGGEPIVNGDETNKCLEIVKI